MTDRRRATAAAAQRTTLSRDRLVDGGFSLQQMRRPHAIGVVLVSMQIPSAHQLTNGPVAPGLEKPRRVATKKEGKGVIEESS